MASFSFGQYDQGETTRKLPATVTGGLIEGIEIVYNKDTRYSNNNANDAVQAKFEINADRTGFDLWLEISEEANFDSQRGGNLYEGLVFVTVGGEKFVLPWAVRVGANFDLIEFDLLAFPQRNIISTSTANTVRSAGTADGLLTAGRNANVSTFWMTFQGTFEDDMDVFLACPETLELKYYQGTITTAGMQDDGTTLYNIFNYFTRTSHRINPDWTITQNQVVVDGAYMLVFGIGAYLYGYFDIGIVYSSGVGEMAVQLTFDTEETGAFPVDASTDVTTAIIAGRIFSPAVALAEKNGFIWTDLDDILVFGEFYEINQSYNMLAWSVTADKWITSTGGVNNFYMPPGATSIANLYVCDEDGYFRFNVPITQANKNGGFAFQNGNNRNVVGVEGVYWQVGRTTLLQTQSWNMMGANMSPATASPQFKSYTEFLGTSPTQLNALLSAGNVSLSTPGSGGYGIAAGSTLVVPAGTTLYVDTILNVRRDATLKIDGTLVIREGGRLNSDGHATSTTGTILISQGGRLVNEGYVEVAQRSVLTNNGTIVNNGTTGNLGRFEIRAGVEFTRGTVSGTRSLTIHREAIIK